MLRPFSLRLYRLSILCGIACVLHSQTAQLAREFSGQIPLALVQEVLPGTSTLEPSENGMWRIKDAEGKALGHAMTTAPESDHRIGYSGPSNLLLVLNPDNEVIGIKLISSRDTPEHVAMIDQSPTFLKQWNGWKRAAPTPKIDAVSGATLTSLAMAEGIQARLAGEAPSLRFPHKIRLEEAREHFPEAAELVDDSEPKRVQNSNHQLLGYLMRTSPTADNISGYAGPTECLVSLDLDGITVRKVTLRQSFDTASYVDQIKEDPSYLKLFEGRTLSTLAGLNFEKERIEGVSGSTQTSYAIAESLKQKASAQIAETPATTRSWQPSVNDWLIGGIVLGSVVLGFSRLRGWPKLRVIWQIMLVSLMGLYGANLISLGLFTGWAQHGLPWRTAGALILLATVALLVPWSTRRQLYCHHLCPHGAAQSLLGRLKRHKWQVPVRIHQWLKFLPGLLLIGLVLATVIKPSLDLSVWEAFDAWSLKATAWISGGIAVLGLVASIFIPQAYCHYGCPTGALLRYLRSPGSADKFGWSDGFAGLVLFAAASMHILWSRT